MFMPLPASLPETFRKLPECSESVLSHKLPDKLPETFRNLPELHLFEQKLDKLPDNLPETFRNLPELRQ